MICNPCGRAFSFLHPVISNPLRFVAEWNHPSGMYSKFVHPYNRNRLRFLRLGRASGKYFSLSQPLIQTDSRDGQLISIPSSTSSASNFLHPQISSSLSVGGSPPPLHDINHVRDGQFATTNTSRLLSLICLIHPNKDCRASQPRISSLFSVHGKPVSGKVCRASQSSISSLFSLHGKPVAGKEPRLGHSQTHNSRRKVKVCSSRGSFSSFSQLYIIRSSTLTMLGSPSSCCC
ncbi:hypothetical protein CsSME_00012789 [Camellia sinensis var. sinensis]